MCASQDCETKTHLKRRGRGHQRFPHASPTAPHPQFLHPRPQFSGTPLGAGSSHGRRAAVCGAGRPHPRARARGGGRGASFLPRPLVHAGGFPESARTPYSPLTLHQPPLSRTPSTAQQPRVPGVPLRHRRAACTPSGGRGLAAIPRPSTPHNGRCAHSPRTPTHAGLAAPRSGSRPAPPPQDPDAAAGAAWRRLSLSLRRQPPPRSSPLPRPQPQPQRRSPGAGGAASVEPQSWTRTPGWRSLHMQRDRRPLARGRWRVRGSANQMPAWGARRWRQGRGEVTTGHSSEPPPAGPGWGPRWAGMEPLGRGAAGRTSSYCSCRGERSWRRCAGGLEASMVPPSENCKTRVHGRDA